MRLHPGASVVETEIRQSRRYDFRAVNDRLTLRSQGFERARLINDFVALALAVDLLDEKHLRAIGPRVSGLQGGTITILGAGTGFGVSCLARNGDRVVPLATEGGHMSFAPTNAEELAVLQLMWKQSGRVSIEHILSGGGLEHLYRTLEQLGGRAPAASRRPRSVPRRCAMRPAPEVL